MRRTTRMISKLAVLVLFGACAGYAGSWTGVLVDAKCYENEERNVNPNDTSFSDRDRNFDIRACRPKARTKSFTVVNRDGQTYKLDAAGNAEAAALVRRAPKDSRLTVAVTGQRSEDTVKVESISLMPPPGK